MPVQNAEIAALPGLGPKRVKLLHERLKVSTLGDLRRVAKAGKLRDVRGLGQTVERRVLAALARPPDGKRFKLSVAEAEAASLLDHLRDGGRIVVAGSCRRRRDTVRDLDVPVSARLAGYENVDHVLVRGPTRTSVVLRSGLQVDVLVVPQAEP